MTTTMDPITWMIGVAGWRDVHMGWYNNPALSGLVLACTSTLLMHSYPRKRMIIPAHSEQKATRGSWPYY